MTPQALIETLRQRVLLADGAMGTRLMSHELHERPECSDKTATHDHGLTAGNTAGDRAEARESGNVEQRRTVDESVRVPEQWLLRFPERIGQIHRSYVAAGSDVICTATFGANRARIATWGHASQIDEIHRIAVRLAKEAAVGAVLVAGDVGPSGWITPRSVPPSDAQLETCFREQCDCLANHGVDLILVETMYSLREATCAVRAAQRTGLAVIASMTFAPSGWNGAQEPRTVDGFATPLGEPPSLCVQPLVDAGATVVGSNCWLTPHQILPVIQAMATVSGTTPLLAKPQACETLPASSQTSQASTCAQPEHFGTNCAHLVQAGARIVGGCCGTDQRHVHSIAQSLSVLGLRAQRARVLSESVTTG